MAPSSCGIKRKYLLQNSGELKANQTTLPTK